MAHDKSPGYALFGSYAFDTVLLHAGHFHSRILPEEIARLNVSFGADVVREELGGTAGNIAYNAALLEDTPVLLGNVGADFSAYEQRLRELGLDTSTLSWHEEHRTARAWLLTDMEHNQITAFYKGAQGANCKLHPKALEVRLWHIAPEDALSMLKMTDLAREHQVSYLFDPGQALPALLETQTEGKADLRSALHEALGLFVNDYEAELLESTLGATLEELGPKNGFVIRTLGAKGAQLYSNGDWEHVPCAKPDKVVDPTGCGDALRAGFLHAYVRGRPLFECVRLGAVMASFAVERFGGQNHGPSKADIEKRMADFGARSLA